jgi:hypothetical protein
MILFLILVDNIGQMIFFIEFIIRTSCDSTRVSPVIQRIIHLFSYVIDVDNDTLLYVD